MTEPVKWGVLGNANIARTCVIPAIQKSRNGCIHALGTRNPADAKRVAEENEIKHVYNNYDAVLADSAIDAVYIPLPNHMHRPWTLKALEAGKHVLCEKPLACDAHEAEEMAHVAAKSGLLLMEAFMYRFHPRTQRIKQVVSEGLIGTPCLVRSAFCYAINPEIFKNGKDARLRPEMGGGALLDVGCYNISVARLLFGHNPTQVYAQAVYHESGADVHVVGTLCFPEDGMATFEASFITALQQTYTIVGRKGAIELPHNAFIPWEEDAIYIVRDKDQEVGQQYVIPGADEYQLMVEHFADAVLAQTDLQFSVKDSIMNMRVLDALAKAARTRQTIALKHP